MNWKKHLYWIVPVAVILLWIVLSYNSLVKSEVEVDTAWSQVQTVYQRRADLIPNLVEIVKGASDFERSVLTQITEARSRWQNARTPEEQVSATNNLESAISRLLVISENYPELKSNTNFLALQDELAGTENRVSVERQRYNEKVGEYNIKLKKFPSNIIANLFGFREKEFFEAKPGSEEAPNIEF